MNVKFLNTRDCESDIANSAFWVSHIRKTGEYNTILPNGECQESAAWSMRNYFDDLADMSLSIFDDMITIITRLKKNEFPDDIKHLIRDKQQIAHNVRLSKTF